MESPPPDDELTPDEVRAVVQHLAASDSDSMDLRALSAVTGHSVGELAQALRVVRAAQERARVDAVLERLEKATYTTPPRYFVKSGVFRAARDPRLEARVLLAFLMVASVWFLWVSVDRLWIHS